MRPHSKLKLLLIAIAIITTSYTFSALFSSPSAANYDLKIAKGSTANLEATTPHLNEQLIQEDDIKAKSPEETESNSIAKNSFFSNWGLNSKSKASEEEAAALKAAAAVGVGGGVAASVAEGSVVPEPIVQRENATFVTLCRNSDLWGIINSIKRVEDRFNHKFKYDWVFLNEEPFTDEFKNLTSALISGEAKYGVIPTEHWSYPEFIDQAKAKTAREEMAKSGIIYAESESYRHMCRFNSGFFFLHPLMLQYKYYWRVEPDINFFCDIDNDLFKFMRENQKVYGFAISIYEFGATIETLWKHTKEFLANNPQAVAKNNMMNFISDDNGDNYNLCHFWSNFEIADMDFWRSPVYMDYFQHLDRTGGFFYERWGDAPVHSIAAALFLPSDKVHFFDGLGYNHGVYTQCPISPEFRMQQKCYCNPDSDFTFRGYSCGKKYYEAMNMTKPANWENYT